VIQHRAASLAVLAAMLGASATAAPLTPPQLPTTGAVQPADLMLVWPTSTQGPLKSIAWSVVLSQMEASLGSVYLQSTNNLADVGSVATARTNLGLGSASVLNTGTSGAALCPLNVGCTWSGKQTIGASTSAGALFNLTPGVAPSSPANGDLWTTASGLFAEINGTTVGPFVSVTAGGLLASNNLSDVASAATSRANLGVTATGADTTYAYRANNLSDLASIVTARTNHSLRDGRGGQRQPLRRTDPEQPGSGLRTSRERCRRAGLSPIVGHDSAHLDDPGQRLRALSGGNQDRVGQRLRRRRDHAVDHVRHAGMAPVWRGRLADPRGLLHRDPDEDQRHRVGARRPGGELMLRGFMALLLLFLLAIVVTALANQARAVPVAWGDYGFQPITDTYTSGSGTETVPSGARQVIITDDGGGGGGACAASGGGGGGGASRSVLTIAVAGGNTLSYAVGGGGPGGVCTANGTNGAGSTVSGTVSGGAVALAAGGGGGGIGSAAGAGGTATGGTTNTSGSAGAAGSGGTGGAGGTAASGATSGSPPGGGGGGSAIVHAVNGAAGQISFAYS
jgi:hypothetical protein